MNITVKAEQPAEGKLAAQVTVAAADVDKAVKQAYKDVANRYNFQGFRRGRAPRQIINAQVGEAYVLGLATEAVVRDAENTVISELDVVPVGDLDYADVEAVKEHEDFTYPVKVTLIPEAELSNADPVAIELPPAGATDEEVQAQIDLLLAYSTTFEDAAEDHAVEDDDIVTLDIANVEGAEDFEVTDRAYTVGSPVMPEEFFAGITGMKNGETKEVTWTPAGDDAQPVKANVTVKLIRVRVTPELSDEVAKSNFGFDTVEDLKKGIAEEIETDKGRQIPQLKEQRALDALAARMDLEEIDPAYLESVYNELGQTVLNQVSQMGVSLDQYLQANGIGVQDFVDDLHAQAEERARQSIALDALARARGIEATEDDITDEIKNAGIEGEEEIAAMRAQLAENAQIPAVKASIKRAKALDWLLETAEVTEVEEATRIVENEAEEVAEKEEVAAEAAAEAEAENAE